MKKQLLKTALIAVAGIGLLSGAASANTTFSISDASFSNVTGNNENLRWSVVADSTIDSFTLTPGATKTFTYGTFAISDFPFDSADKSDNDDSFTANFSVAPPDLDLSGLGSIDAYVASFLFWSWDQLTVNFVDTWQTISFGNGGSYQLKFNDLTITDNSGVNCPYDLTADIKLIKDSSPVPEPATMLLFGAGIAGLAAVGRRKRS